MTNENNNLERQIQYLVYKTPDNSATIDVIARDETIWATQAALAILFDIDRTGIGRHLKNIFEDRELDEKVVCAEIAHATPHGAMSDRTQEQISKFYNLDAIIAVGYRVNSKKATAFRIWATGVLKEYIIKGFAMDDERLKQASTPFGKDYFKELLERIRSIRASERRIWLQITDIFAEISIDYDKNSEITREFYATVQNKFHYAITGQTAAEIIYAGADRNKENMGLTTWKKSPSGRILKSDTEIAKNYLDEKQIRRLERSVSGFFDYVEDLIENENVFTMADFAASIDNFINFRNWKVLPDKGKISHELAIEKAHAEYDEFNKTQKIISDFERTNKKLKESI
jgi:hypothetical protein